MAQISVNDLRSGMKVEVDQEPYTIVNNEFVKPGKGQAFNRIRMKHLLSAKTLERTFKSTEKVDLADVVEQKMRLLYTEAEAAIFMDDNSYDQVNVSFSVIQEKQIWLKEDIVYDLIFYKGNVVDLIPPTFMELKIKETSPGVRGDTASGRVLKPAILETEGKIQVPIFIEEGEVVKVDTRTGEYVSRV